MRFALLGMVVCGQAFGQTPFVNFYWEASDGGSWTRTHFTATQQSVQIRLVAEWGGSEAYGFAGTGLDVYVDSADVGDTAHNLMRPAPFDLAVGSMVAIRQGNLIKLDNELDLDAPGAGELWIQISQSNGGLGTPIDPVNPAVIFRFDLLLADVGGTRHVSSIHQMRAGTPPFNAGLYTELGAGIRVVAPVFGVDVTYVPTPGCLSLLASAGVIAQRRKR